jgi:tellurite resistance protein TehA-like permease
LGSALGILSFFVSFYVVKIFPDYVPIATADDLLKILIEVDGILLGFVGIVFAQLLSSIMYQQNVLYERILEKRDEVANESKLLEFLGRRKFVLSLSTIGTFLFLILSIFSSMANIAKDAQFKPTDTYATFGVLFVPLSYVIVAVVLLIISLVGLPMKLPLENTRTAN